MAMHNPPYPGGIVKRQCLEPFGLTVTRADERLGVTRQALSELVNERTGISVEMAIRLSKAFSSTPETWPACRWPGIFGRPASALARLWSRNSRRRKPRAP